MSEKFDRSKDQATVSPGNYEIPVHRQIFPLERIIAHFPTKGESSKNVARILLRTLREIKSRNLILKCSRNTRCKDQGQEKREREESLLLLLENLFKERDCILSVSCSSH